ncbi:MAG: hypothetical protein ACRDJC_09695 [Thermomicrobiales bacterium]
MDPYRFDVLTRSLTLLRSRRAMTRGIGGLMLGGAFGVRDDQTAVARPCPPCRKKKKGACKGKRPNGTPCPGGVCRGGRCLPPTCATRDDCASALCIGGVCRACDPAIAGQCGFDANGACFCDMTADDGRLVCNSGAGNIVSGCGECRPGTNCREFAGTFTCHERCGLP